MEEEQICEELVGMERDAFGRTLHDIVCDKCGVNSRVPFVPDGKRRVFCQDCHKQQDNKFDNRRDNRSGGFGGGERQFTTTNCTECHAETSVPFRPALGRPVYCRECFRKQNPNTY